MSGLIIFVCKGNIHRSVVAEHLARKLLRERGYEDVSVESRGLQWYISGPPAHKNLMGYGETWKKARESIEEHGIDMSEHEARALSLKDMEEAAAVVVMDQELLTSHRMSVHRLFPEHRQKAHLFGELVGEQQDVDDRGEHASQDAYRAAVEQIEHVLTEGLDRLLSWASVLR